MWRGDALHRFGQAADRLDAGHGVELEAGQRGGCSQDEIAPPAVDAGFGRQQHQADEAERHAGKRVVEIALALDEPGNREAGAGDQEHGRERRYPAWAEE